MQRIISGYERGTNFNIHMEEDGLISAGAGLDQVTWMDVRVGEILPTPRHGKPGEINAYWYNALCIMQKFSEVLKKNEEQKYGELAQKVKESFAREFWMEEKHCLKDVISETKADTQIRCNQIWAVSMPFTMLDEEKERQIVDTVVYALWTSDIRSKRRGVSCKLWWRDDKKRSCLSSGNCLDFSDGWILSRLSKSK